MSWRIVAARDDHDLLRLQALAEEVFGTGDRRPQWFADKLDRECIEPAVTQVAMHGDDPIGYVLVGRPPSLAPVVRAAGTAVVQQWRGRGIASALLDAAMQAADGAALELWAEHGVEPFYTSRGFTRDRSITTMLAFGRARAAQLPDAGQWHGSGTELHAYLEEAWTRTPASRRHTFVFADLGARVHVCREGRAFALHRTLVEDPAHAPAVFDRVLERLPNAAPVIAIALPDTSPDQMAPPAVSSVTPSLRTAGWVDIQRARILRRAGHLAQRPR